MEVMRFFIEPILMIVGVGVVVGLMYAGSTLYQKAQRQKGEK